MHGHERAPRGTGESGVGRRTPRAEARTGLADQLLLLQQTAGNLATTDLIQRQRADDEDSQQATPPRAVPATMSRADFESTVADRYGVGAVVTGTLESQISSLDRLGGPAREGVTRPGQLLGQLASGGTLPWSAWDLGSESVVYSSILQGFADLARDFGGTPPVNTIVFYRTDYRATSSAPGLEEARATGATYSGHALHVFSRAVSAVHGFPIERDEPGSPGRRPEMWATQHVSGVSVHELAHGIQEAALTPPADSSTAPAPDPTLMADYRQAAGWVGSRLYDIGDAAISAQLRAGQPPANARPITGSTWDSGDWHEQPVSAYSLQNASEDFAEAVTAFVESPSALRARSPHRFEFLEERRPVIEHYLRAPTSPSTRH